MRRAHNIQTSGQTSRQTAGAAILLALLLAGCASQATRPPASPSGTAPGAGAQQPVTPAEAGAHPVEGKRFDVVAADSLLTIRVYRAGTLARLGHNHVIASHDLSGSVTMPEDLTAASFELRFPVARLTVDEAQLRQQEGPDFAAEVPDSARDGTRRNMLGDGLLNAGRFPEIVLKSERVEVTAPNELLAHARITVRDRTSSITVPVHHEMDAAGLVVTGELAINQTDLGLTPFSVMMGALQVQDEMKIRFRIRCVAAADASQ